MKAATSIEREPDVPAGTVSRLFEETYEGANKCIQCGYCLPVCPTYKSMGRESASPRGRINLVKAAAEGKIDLLKDMARPLELCLGCRACEVACPVGVPYGEILEGGKAAVRRQRAEPEETRHRVGGRLERVALRRLFPFPGRLRTAGNLVWLAQRTGLQRMANASGLVKRVFPAMGSMLEIMPALESPWRRLRSGTVLPAIGERRARVAFFQGCVMNAALYRINRLSVDLLRKVGCEVVITKDQRCCGALHLHQGNPEEAVRLARANIEAFEQSEAEFYVNNAGGCGAMLREYSGLFKADSAWRNRAENFARRTRDITELLVEFGPLPIKRKAEGFVTYQDSCHLRNAQKVIEPPRILLRQVAGERYVELPGASECCASGGIYNLLHFEESMRILDAKMEEVRSAAATTVVTTNPGCQLQMALGIRRAGLQDRVRSCHLVELLAQCVE